jgi:hypothetical protein
MQTKRVFILILTTIMAVFPASLLPAKPYIAMSLKLLAQAQHENSAISPDDTQVTDLLKQASFLIANKPDSEWDRIKSKAKALAYLQEALSDLRDGDRARVNEDIDNTINELYLDLGRIPPAKRDGADYAQRPN